MAIIAVCNQKGGVGKTTLATNLAAMLRDRTGKKNLLIDCDPQGNATTTVGVELSSDDFTLNDVLAGIAAGNEGKSALQAIKTIPVPWNIDLLPANRLLASREADDALGREMRLKTVTSALARRYANIIIDCPPTLGVLTTNALVAAEKAVIVTTARETAADGVAEMVSTIATVRTFYNPQLTLAGIILNSYRPDRVDRRLWAEQLAEQYGSYLISTPLPEREAIAAASSKHLPIPDRQNLRSTLEDIAHKIMGDK